MVASFARKIVSRVRFPSIPPMGFDIAGVMTAFARRVVGFDSLEVHHIWQSEIFPIYRGGINGSNMFTMQN